MSEYLTVTSVNRYLKHRLEQDPHLQDIYIKGEISNFKLHGTGHCYFSLKDDGGRINAIMFKFNAAKLKFKPLDGMHVLVHGKISIYEATGNYQIYIDDMLEDGVGNLYVAYEQLKKQLMTEGLFDEATKQALPSLPKRIGVITAPTGAAVKDVITTIQRRWPLVEIIVIPTLVQGEGAKESIVKNINRADDLGLDLIILGRGGGSIEDLWAFNEEIVARAVYAAKTPIISAVGHETDTTIVDCVSDLRAPTPTAAAEIAVPDKLEILNQIKRYQQQLISGANRKLEIVGINLKRLQNSFILKNINTLYEPKLEKLILLADRLNKSVTTIINDASNGYQMLVQKLIILNPLETLNRGYAVASVSGNVMTSVKDIKLEDELIVRLSDGRVKTKVISKEEVKHG